MTSSNPDLNRLGNALRASTAIDLAREESAAHAAVPARRPRRKLLAGSTLGLAGVGAGLVLALSGSTAAPAFAVTKQDDGSVLVQLNYTIPSERTLGQVNQKLAAMGTNEQITIYGANGPATVSGPVTCTPATGAAAPTGPTVQVLVGTNGTEVIAPGQSAGNTAEGTFHLAQCVTSTASGAGAAGNSGNVKVVRLIATPSAG